MLIINAKMINVISSTVIITIYPPFLKKILCKYKVFAAFSFENGKIINALTVNRIVKIAPKGRIAKYL